MEIAELIEIALANSDERRVEVAALEPAVVTTEAVGGLTQLVSELVDNAIAFSEPYDRVRVTGLVDQENYLITISDRGVGIPEHLIEGLNRVLEDPAAPGGAEPKLGIALVARLAARHGIGVRLVPGAPGTTARVTVPADLVSTIFSPAGSDEKPEPPAEHRLPARQESQPVFARRGDAEDTVDVRRFGGGYRTGVVTMSEEAKREAETFLETVFGPLMRRHAGTERPAARPSNGKRPKKTQIDVQRPAATDPGGTVTALQVRVPGDNFSVIEDEPSTIASEGAIDTRSALSRYEQGRRSAEQAETDS